MCYVRENAFKLIKKMPLNCDIPEYTKYHTIFWETIANLCKEFKLEENVLAAMEEYAQEVVKNNAELPIIHIIMPSLRELDFKKMRKDKGLTLREVEKQTGISNAYLSQLETGKIKNPGYETVIALYNLYSNGA
jgi:hypothetical protein